MVFLKSWDNFSLSLKFLVELVLWNIMVMLIKMGMKKLNEVFFFFVKLFDDLLMFEGCVNVKEKFFMIFGVRKIVDLDIIFMWLLSLIFIFVGGVVL